MFSVKCASAYFFFAAYSFSFALKYFFLHCIIFAAQLSRVKARGFNLALHLVLWLHHDAVIVPHRTVAETLLPLVECQESGNMYTECKGTQEVELDWILLLTALGSNILAFAFDSRRILPAESPQGLSWLNVYS